MNLMEGVVTDKNRAQIAGAELALPGAVLAQTTAGERIIVGVRPEAATLAHGVTPEGLTPEGRTPAARVPGTVQMVEPDYARRVQYVRIETPLGDFTVSDTSNEPLAITQKVQIELLPERAYFFHAQTGERLG